MSSGNPAIPQSWNRYSYCINNPLRFVDPEGLVWGVYYDSKKNHSTYKWFEDEIDEEGYKPVTSHYVEHVVDGNLVGINLNPLGPYSFWKWALISSTNLQIFYSHDDYFVHGYTMGPTKAQVREFNRTGAVDMMPNQAFELGLFGAGLRGINLMSPVKFYRGTTHYDAAEAVANQAINAERLAARQAGKTLDLGEGVYMSRSLDTAKDFAQAQGAVGRQGGPGVLEMSISKFRFNQLQQSFGAVDRATISRMPGHTQSFVPTQGIDFFNKHATFRFPK